MFHRKLSTLYYYNAPSLATRFTGDYRGRTYTGKCSPALLDTRKKKRIAAYCRVSTGLEEQQSSLKNQTEAFYRMISLREDWTLAGIYADEGKSGTDAVHRHQFNRLLEDARKRKIDIILVKSISRFARNISDCQNYARELRQLGIEVLFEKEGISNMNPSSEFIFSILSVAAQAESRNLSEHIRWSIRKKYEKGVHHLGYHRVLGYDCIDGTLIPNQDA